MRKTVKLPTIQNVSAGAAATLSVPVRPTYEKFSLVYSGVTLAQIKNIEVSANGKVLQRFESGSQLDFINQFYGRQAAGTNSVLTLYMVRPELVELADQRLTALGTADLQTVTIKFDIDAAAAAPVVDAYAEVSAPQPLGSIVKVRQFPRTFATSGQQEIDSIPRSGARIAALHLFKDDVSAVEIEANGTTIYEATKTVGEEFQEQFGRSPQTAQATHIDFLLDGDIAQALMTKGLQDLRLKPTLDTIGQVTSVVEYIDGFEGI